MKNINSDDDISIEILDLPSRALRFFRNRKINTLSEILKLTYKDFQYLPEIGESTVFKIFQRLIAVQIDVLDKQSLSNIRHFLPANTPEVIIERLILDRKTFIKPRTSSIMKLSDYIASITNNRDRDILSRLFNGETLQSVGLSFRVSRERVRQIRDRLLSKRPTFTEDVYKHYFLEYNFSEDSFCEIFNESKQVFFYLDSVYKRGEKNIEEFIDNPSLTTANRETIEKKIFKNYIYINSKRIKLARREILDYLIHNFALNTISFKDFYGKYQSVLLEHKLDTKDPNFPDTEYFLHILPSHKNIIWKPHRIFRFYDLEKYNINELSKKIRWAKYMGKDMSAKKIFNENISLMTEYDINDEYELHNLLRKHYQQEFPQLYFNRTPHLKVGFADRKTQLLDILRAVSPISSAELIRIYSAKYGVEKDTISGNFLKLIKEFKNGDIFSIPKT